MKQQHLGLFAGVAICLSSSLAVAAAPAETKAPAAAPAQAAAPTPAPASDAKPDAAPAPAAAPAAKKRARGGHDARSCLQQPNNTGVRRCAEKYR